MIQGKFLEKFPLSYSYLLMILLKQVLKWQIFPPTFSSCFSSNSQAATLRNVIFLTGLWLAATIHAT